jgi:chromosome partitioning protein
MIILTVCNHKGGTGKTTTSIHMAAALGLSGYRTLVIDLDPQGFLSSALGIKEPAVEASSAMLFNRGEGLKGVPVKKMRSFDVLGSSSVLSKMMRRLNKPTDVFWAKESLEQELDYDIVLIDTAAAITVYSLNALVASRYVVIPVTPEYQPVLGGEQTFQTSMMVQEKLNPTLSPPLILLTQVDGRKRSHQIFRQYLRQRYGQQVMKTIIRTSAALSQSHRDGTTVFDHDPTSRGAVDYANATDEILGYVAADGNLPQPVTKAKGVDAWTFLDKLGS